LAIVNVRFRRTQDRLPSWLCANLRNTDIGAGFRRRSFILPEEETKRAVAVYLSRTLVLNMVFYKVPAFTKVVWFDRVPSRTVN